MADTVIGDDSHNEIFKKEVSTILLKYMKLLKYDPNKKIHWLGDIYQLKSLISELFGSSGKWSLPGTWLC